MTVIEFFPFAEHIYRNDITKRKIIHRGSNKIYQMCREYITQVYEIDYNLTNETHYGGMLYNYSYTEPVLTVLNPKPAKILVYNKEKRRRRDVNNR